MAQGLLAQLLTDISSQRDEPRSLSMLTNSPMQSGWVPLWVLLLRGQSPRDSSTKLPATRLQRAGRWKLWDAPKRITKSKTRLKTMLRLVQEHEKLHVVADQYGVPILVCNIVDVTANVLVGFQCNQQTNWYLSGIHHLSASGKTTQYGFFRTIIDFFKVLYSTESTQINYAQQVATEDCSLPVARPANLQLQSNALSICFGISIPEWLCAMYLCVNGELEAYEST